MICTKCGQENPKGSTFCRQCGNREFVPSPSEQGVRYANFSVRLLASLIDGVVCFSLLFATFYLFVTPPAGDVGYPGSFTELLFAFLFFTLSWWIYCTSMECSPKQATLGKMAVGIIVTDTEGRAISIKKASIRFITKLSSILLAIIPFLIIVKIIPEGSHDIFIIIALLITFYLPLTVVLFTEKKQAFHDIASGCIVIEKHF